MLVAFRMDKIEINSGKGFYEVDALVAITKLDGETKALVPGALLK
jgi:hypothetical protein